MDTPFTIHDINWGREDFFFFAQQGTILLTNGYAVNFEQSDVEPKDIPLGEACFILRILKPIENSTGLDGILIRSTPAALASHLHPLDKLAGLSRQEAVHECTIEDIATLVNAVSELQTQTKHGTALILRRNTVEPEGQWKVTQLGKYPIEEYSGRVILQPPEPHHALIQSL